MIIIEFLIVGMLLLGCAGCWAAYRNGVNDGYNAGKYPDHPGYQKARKILEKTGQWREVVPDYWSDIEMHLLKHRGKTPGNPRKPNTKIRGMCPKENDHE